MGGTISMTGLLTLYLAIFIPLTTKILPLTSVGCLHEQLDGWRNDTILGDNF